MAYMPYITYPKQPNVRRDAALLVFRQGWSTSQAARHYHHAHNSFSIPFLLLFFLFYNFLYCPIGQYKKFGKGSNKTNSIISISMYFLRSLEIHRNRKQAPRRASPYGPSK
jgi:hypothetical protein